MTESATRSYETIDPDARLMLRVRDGEAGAFEEIVRRYQGRLLTVLENLVGSRELAEDLAQDVFLRVFRARLRYVPEAKFSTWLFTIARYKHIDRIRRDSRHQTESDEPDLRPSEEPEADAEVLQSQRADAVRKVVASLPQDQQTVIAMSFNQGLSHSEIAEQLGLPLGTVKSRIRRAFQRMREELGDLQ